MIRGWIPALNMPTHAVRVDSSWSAQQCVLVQLSTVPLSCVLKRYYVLFMVFRAPSKVIVLIPTFGRSSYLQLLLTSVVTTLLCLRIVHSMPIPPRLAA